MWVRSQDKKILIDITGCTVRLCQDHSGEYCVSISEYTILGQYESEKRALEVLDEIQHQIVTCQSMDSIVSGTRIKKEVVYEMPEE